jgi:hypothetical protein
VTTFGVECGVGAGVARGGRGKISVERNLLAYSPAWIGTRMGRKAGDVPGSGVS